MECTDMMNRKSTAEAVRDLYTQRAALYRRLFIDVLGIGEKLRKFFDHSQYLHSHMKILDAGCGSGLATSICWEHAVQKKLEGMTFHAFDITPAMLKRLHYWAEDRRAKNVAWMQADILHPEQLPPDWNNYDLIVSSWMLEYIPRTELRVALQNLRNFLRMNGTMVAFVTQKNVFTRWFIEQWWRANTYHPHELEDVFSAAGFLQVRLSPLNRWGNTLVIEAKK